MLLSVGVARASCWPTAATGTGGRLTAATVKPGLRQIRACVSACADLLQSRRSRACGLTVACCQARHSAIPLRHWIGCLETAWGFERSPTGARSARVPRRCGAGSEGAGAVTPSSEILGGYGVAEGGGAAATVGEAAHTAEFAGPANPESARRLLPQQARGSSERRSRLGIAGAAYAAGMIGLYDVATSATVSDRLRGRAPIGASCRRNGGLAYFLNRRFHLYRV